MFWHWRKHPRDGECLTVFVLFCIHSPDCWINQPGHCLCFALRTPLIFQSSPISDIGGADSSSSLKTPAVQGCETSTHAHRAVNKALQTDSYMQASLYNCGVCRHLHQYCIAFILHDLSNAHTLFSLKEFTTLKLRHLNTVRGKKHGGCEHLDGQISLCADWRVLICCWQSLLSYPTHPPPSSHHSSVSLMLHTFLQFSPPHTWKKSSSFPPCPWA